MIDRIEQLRAEAEAAIARRDSTRRARGAARALPRPQGRAAQPAARRRPAAARGARRRSARRANQARQALEAADRARARRSSRPRELDARLAQDRVDVTLPGDAAAAGRAPAPAHRRPGARSRTSSSASGFTVVEGPEIDTVHYNFDALNHDPTHPARDRHRHVLRRADDVVPAHAHLADADPRDGGPAAAALRRHPGAHVPAATSDATHTPQFHQVEGLAVDEDITLADLKGTLLAFARAIFGEEREVRLRPHFFPFTEPSVEVDVSCFNCDGTGFLPDGSRCRAVQGRGLDRDPRRRRGRPERLRLRATTTRYDPEKVQGFAWGMGIERIAMLKHGVTDLRLLLRQRPALPGAVRLMRVPSSGCTSTCDPALPTRASSRSA